MKYEMKSFLNDKYENLACEITIRKILITLIDTFGDSSSFLVNNLIDVFSGKQINNKINNRYFLKLFSSNPDLFIKTNIIILKILHKFIHSIKYYRNMVEFNYKENDDFYDFIDSLSYEITYYISILNKYKNLNFIIPNNRKIDSNQIYVMKMQSMNLIDLFEMNLKLNKRIKLKKKQTDFHSNYLYKTIYNVYDLFFSGDLTFLVNYLRKKGTKKETFLYLNNMDYINKNFLKFLAKELLQIKGFENIIISNELLENTHIDKNNILKYICKDRHCEEYKCLKLLDIEYNTKII